MTWEDQETMVCKILAYVVCLALFLSTEELRTLQLRGLCIYRKATWGHLTAVGQTQMQPVQARLRTFRAGSSRSSGPISAWAGPGCGVRKARW